MDVTYAIVKVYVTKRNGVNKLRSNFITLWWMPAFEVTAFKKKKKKKPKKQTSMFRYERCARKRIYDMCEGQIEQSIPCDQFDITRQTSWCQTVTLRTEFSVHSSHQWEILILSRVWGVGRKIRPSRSQSDITQEASWCQTITLRTAFFLSTPHLEYIFIRLSRSQSGISRQAKWCQTGILDKNFSIYPSHKW